MHIVRLGYCVAASFLFLNLLELCSTAIASSPLPKTKDESARLFDYDRSIAFDLQEVSAKEQDGIVIRDVNYAAYTSRRGRIKTYLIEPAGEPKLLMAESK